MPKRTGLSETAITEHALALVDADGVEGLSMRRLATALDVSPMALYSYFTDRDALLEAVAQLLYARIEPPHAEGSPRQILRELMHAVRDVLLRHPKALPLMGRFPPRTLEALAFVDAGYRALLDAGVAPLDTARAYRALAAYSLGTATVETGGYFASHHSGRVASPTVDAETLRRLLPHVAEVGPLLDELDDTAEFDYGLDLTLDGFLRRHGAD